MDRVTLTDRLDRVLGEKPAERLDTEFGIRTVEDLLRHYPRSYVERMAVRDADEQQPPVGEHVTLIDVITESKTHRMKRRPGEFLVITLGDPRSRNRVTATFFNARGLKWKLTKNTKVMLSGDVGYYRGVMQLTHPDFLILDSEDNPKASNFGSSSLRNIADASRAVTGEVLQSEFERRFYPIYPASSKLQTWDIFACVRQVLDVLDPVPDPMPASLRAEHGLIGEDEALRAVHLGEDRAQRQRALERLRFDEAIGLQWALAGRRRSAQSESGPPAPRRPDGLVAELTRRLPFELTAGQCDVLEVIGTELASKRPMNRLLQGEVGSGKTIVAVLAMLQLVDAGYQCALLAPTEVLAAQHARSIRDVLGPLAFGGQLGVDLDVDATSVALLTGSMPAAAKKAVRAEIASGRAGIVVGTHALLVDAVEFDNLGMVVVDEQHRFGVEQRDRLRTKAREGVTPHLLVMTATPIPRTVALTVYGDLETSTLRELPRGRRPVATTAVFVGENPGWLARAWQRIREEVAAGRQVYVVAPRIDETDAEAEVASAGAAGGDSAGDEGAQAGSATAVGLFNRLSADELAGLRLGLMHGRLSAEEKDSVMAAFRSGQIDVLVCTTVIEVGVDVPNATVMLVFDADRFGISQLHQLRGRIGRGAHDSICLLVTRVPPGSAAGRRVAAVAETSDGFKLAELDLLDRREGDVLGRNQSGANSGLQLLSIIEHRELVELARDFCERSFDEYEHDPGLASLAARFTDADRIDYLDKA